ncbi:MAG: hypothetical protein ACXWFG_15210 [Methylobacter sp.]
MSEKKIQINHQAKLAVQSFTLVLMLGKIDLGIMMGDGGQGVVMRKTQRKIKLGVF